MSAALRLVDPIEPAPVSETRRCVQRTDPKLHYSVGINVGTKANGERAVFGTWLAADLNGAICFKPRSNLASIYAGGKDLDRALAAFPELSAHETGAWDITRKERLSAVDLADRLAALPGGLPAGRQWKKKAPAPGAGALRDVEAQSIAARIRILQSLLQSASLSLSARHVEALIKAETDMAREVKAIGATARRAKRRG